MKRPFDYTIALSTLLLVAFLHVLVGCKPQQQSANGTSAAQTNNWIDLSGSPPSNALPRIVSQELDANLVKLAGIKCEDADGHPLKEIPVKDEKGAMRVRVPENVSVIPQEDITVQGYTIPAGTRLKTVNGWWTTEK